jgi:hypothetical protein
MKSRCYSACGFYAHMFFTNIIGSSCIRAYLGLIDFLLGETWYRTCLNAPSEWNGTYWCLVVTGEWRIRRKDVLWNIGSTLLLRVPNFVFLSWYLCANNPILTDYGVILPFNLNPWTYSNGIRHFLGCASQVLRFMSLFVWLISHQPAVLFSQNKPAPAISHQPNEQATCLMRWQKT